MTTPTLPALTIWWARPPRGFDPTSALEMLDAEERLRFRAFDRAEMARFFAFRRAARRVLLGSTLSLPPAQVRIVTGARGKPALAEPDRDLHFSTSDSRDLAIVAISRAGPIGVDVEVAGTRSDRIPERVLSEAERARCTAAPDDAREAVFLRAWTAKEAFVKATGDGLSLDALANMTTPEGNWAPMEIAGAECKDRWLIHAAERHIAGLGPAHVAVAAQRAADLSFRPAAALLREAGLQDDWQGR